MLRISACKAQREESGWEKEMKDFDKADTGAGKQTLVLCMHLPILPAPGFGRYSSNWSMITHLIQSDLFSIVLSGEEEALFPRD